MLRAVPLFGKQFALPFWCKGNKCLRFVLLHFQSVAHFMVLMPDRSFTATPKFPISTIVFFYLKYFSIYNIQHNTKIVKQK